MAQAGTSIAMMAKMITFFMGCSSFWLLQMV